MARVMIVGAGAWGTALAVVMSKTSQQVTLWTRNAVVFKDVLERHCNERYLPHVKLDKKIHITMDLSKVQDAGILIVAVPVQQVRSVLIEMRPFLSANTPLVLTSKGIEQISNLFLSEVVQQELPTHSCAVLSGPTFAHEVAQGLPTMVVMAAASLKLAQDLAHQMACSFFRVYPSTDRVGVQLAGAFKNILAIGCGVVMGRQWGENARATLIAKGLAEMLDLGNALGAQSSTFMGPAGVGDVVLTCTSMNSRNTALGIELGKHKAVAIKEVLDRYPKVSEGIYTSTVVKQLSDTYGIEMPVFSAIADVLQQAITIDEAFEQLLARPLDLF